MIEKNRLLRARLSWLQVGEVNPRAVLRKQFVVLEHMVANMADLDAAVTGTAIGPHMDAHVAGCGRPDILQRDQAGEAAQAGCIGFCDKLDLTHVGTRDGNRRRRGGLRCTWRRDEEILARRIGVALLNLGGVHPLEFPIKQRYHRHPEKDDQPAGRRHPFFYPLSPGAGKRVRHALLRRR